MTAKNYCMINDETKICENIVVWDGGSDWTPPNGYTLLPQETIFANVWAVNKEKTDYEIQKIIGQGQIGFVWDGENLNTNLEKPFFDPSRL